MCELNPSNAGRRLDPCMKGLIKRLNKEGYKTIACCCGHGKYPMTIVYKMSFGFNREFISGKVILRKKRFYKRDEEGYYFIPETIENGNLHIKHKKEQ